MSENEIKSQVKEIISGSIQKNWQRIVNILADLLDTRVALITRVDKPEIEIVKTNNSSKNPFQGNQTFKLAGHYCEQVIKNQKMLQVENSIKNEDWIDNPELEYGLISYLGFPIIKPNGEIFGTICVLDQKERKYSQTQKDLLLEFKKVVENSLENIELRNELNTRLEEITGLKDKYKTLFNNINDALFLHEYNPGSKKNKIGKFIEVNEKACEILEYSKEELLNLSPDKIDSSEFDESQEKRKILKQLEDQGEITFEAEHVSKSGNKIPVEINSKIIEYNNQKMVLSIARDITERKKEREKIQYYSFHDQLTDLYNRRYFEEEIDRLNQSRKFPISIIVGDMDGLKDINDNYGHRMGDKYLKKEAEIFKSVTRKEDIVARIGGDEFAVILPQTGPDSAQKVCTRVRKKGEWYNKKEELPLPISISLGYASAINKKQSLEDIFKNADINMYDNKGRSHRQ